MNIYRWENGNRVVEIMANSLPLARLKGSHYLAPAEYEITLEQPQNVRACSKSAVGEDCVKTWRNR